MSVIQSIIKFDKGVSISNENDVTSKVSTWSELLTQSFNALKLQAGSVMFPCKDGMEYPKIPRIVGTVSKGRVHIDLNHKCYPFGQDLSYTDGTVAEVSGPVKGDVKTFETNILDSTQKMFNMHLLTALAVELATKGFEKPDNVISVAELLYDLIELSVSTGKTFTVESVKYNQSRPPYGGIRIFTERNMEPGTISTLVNKYKMFNITFSCDRFAGDYIKWSFMVTHDMVTFNPYIIFTSCAVPEEDTCTVAVYTRDFTLDIASNIKHVISKGKPFTFTATIESAILDSIGVNTRYTSGNLLTPNALASLGIEVSKLLRPLHKGESFDKHVYSIGIPHVTEDMTIDLRPVMTSKSQVFLQFENVAVDRMVKVYNRTPGTTISWDVSIATIVNFSIKECTEIYAFQLPVSKYQDELADMKYAVGVDIVNLSCGEGRLSTLKFGFKNLKDLPGNGDTILIRVIFNAGAAECASGNERIISRNCTFAVQFEIDKATKKIIQTYAQYINTGYWQPRVPQELLVKTVGLISPYCHMRAYDTVTGIYEIVFNEGYDPAEICLGIPADVNYHMCKMEVPIEYENKYFAVLKIPTHSINNSYPMLDGLAKPISERAVYDSVTVKSKTRQLFNLDCANSGINEDTLTAVYVNPKLIVKDGFVLIPVIFDWKDNIELTIIEDEKPTVFRFNVYIDYPTEDGNGKGEPSNEPDSPIVPDEPTTDDGHGSSSNDDNNTEDNKDESDATGENTENSSNNVGDDIENT